MDSLTLTEFVRIIRPMQIWAQAVLILCAVALTVALVAVLISLRRTLQRTESVLAVLEGELKPLTGKAAVLVEELSDLIREARGDMEHLGVVIGRIQGAADGMARFTTAVAGFTRAGQLVGLVTGLRKGAEVFVRRLRK
jgi:uncharacterized protein YoxC